MFGGSDYYWCFVAGVLLLGTGPAFGQSDPRDLATYGNSGIPGPPKSPLTKNDEGHAPGIVPSEVFDVENFVVGNKAAAGQLRDFQCKASDQFLGYEWCQQARNESTAAKGYLTSLLRKQDGTVVYASRSITPTLLNRAQALKEIARLAARYSEQARVLWMPRREGLPDAVAAYWGKVELEPLNPTSLSNLAAGNAVREGLLLDYLGDFRKSARSGLPVYRLSGGAGYVWSASFLPDGRGHTRLLVVDASSIQNRRPEPPTTETSPTKNETVAAVVNNQPSVANELLVQNDRKGRFQKLSGQTIKANPKFYEYLVKKTELAGLPFDIPILRVVFEERVFFDTAQSNLRPDALGVLDVVSNALKQDSRGVVLFVAGHTDSRGSDAYNMELSTKRASSVADAIKQRTDNINIWRIGFGKAIPLKPNSSPENMAVNRRVEFILASRLEAVTYWIRDQWKYLCVGEPASQPEFCKDASSLAGDFSAVPVTTIDIKPGTATIAAPEPIDIKLVQPTPDQTEIVLPPPSVTEVGRPEL